MSGRDHETDHDGECFPDCKECKMNRIWKEGVRRRDAIEKHRIAMESEKIQDYYFDRELWSVLDEK